MAVPISPCCTSGDCLLLPTGLPLTSGRPPCALIISNWSPKYWRHSLLPLPQKLDPVPIPLWPLALT